jgi:hypothetical protein
MAKIDMRKFRAAGERRVTVGNNRAVSRVEGRLDCFLHGHRIVQVEGDNVTLDTCGYPTPTTRQAMADFLEAETGLVWSVSLAKGTAIALGRTFPAPGQFNMKGEQA